MKKLLIDFVALFIGSKNLTFKEALTYFILLLVVITIVIIFFNASVPNSAL